jgi:N-acetyl-alpha-D-muramate 1-phosphate uridylyltransferase
MFPIAILAGGLATRLHPLTERLPKSLLPVAGRPFIFHQLELLRSQGLRRVVLCVGHLGQQIEAAVGDGGRFGLAVDYSYDGESLRGTGGALRAALPLLGSTFFVLYGDSYLPCSFDSVRRAYETAHRPALMTILRNDNRWDRSNVAVRDDGSIEYSKDPTRSDLTCIDFGLSVLSAQVLQRYPGSEYLDLSGIWRDLSGARELAAFEVHERFYEIGSKQGIVETEEFLLRQRRYA